MATQALIPTDINVQFGPTQEYPEGRVVPLKAGLIDLDDDVAAHPVIARLVSDSPIDTALAEKMLKAGQTRDEAIAQAQSAYAEEVQAAQKEAQEARSKLADEWAQKAIAARAKGELFTEPNPDPEAARAYNLTAQPIGAFPVGFNQSSLGQLGPVPEPPDGTPPAPPGEDTAEGAARTAARTRIR